MRTPLKAKPAQAVRLLARAALPIVALTAGTLVAGTAYPQTPSPYPTAPPESAPPPGPTPGPAAGPYGAPPTTYGAPPPSGQAPGAAEPAPEAAPTDAPASFDFHGGASFGAPLPPPGGARADKKADDEWAYRERSLSEQINTLGSTGLLHTSYAGSGAEGTFRVGFLFDWFTAGGFLCNADTPCALLTPDQATEDEASHVGALFALNVTPIDFLEGYAAVRTYAASNTHSSPGLLQVLGDTTFGVKGFTPMRVGDIFTFGGEIRLLLLNGAGEVGIGGVNADFMALASADFREPSSIDIPLRIHFNTGYRLDSSGGLVQDVEELRAQRDPATSGGLDRIPISRIERFGLGIDRVDFYTLALGVDVPTRYVQPYLEYSVDIPVNRQGYECHTRTISPGDVCLALSDLDDEFSGAPGYAATPSRLSLGARTTPFDESFRGLSAHVGFDIGLSATSTFIEEVSPEPPWMLYLGMGYAFDTKEKKEKAEAPPPLPPPLPPPPPPEYFVRGVVTEQGAQTPVADAIIAIQGQTDPPIATAADGKFLTRALQPGSYTLELRAPDYKPGTCAAVVQPAPTAGAWPQPQPTEPGMRPGGAFGPPPYPGPGASAPPAPGSPPPSPGVGPAAPAGPGRHGAPPRVRRAGRHSRPQSAPGEGPPHGRNGPGARALAPG